MINVIVDELTTKLNLAVDCVIKIAAYHILRSRTSQHVKYMTMLTAGERASLYMYDLITDGRHVRGLYWTDS